MQGDLFKVLSDGTLIVNYDSRLRIDDYVASRIRITNIMRVKTKEEYDRY